MRKSILMHAMLAMSLAGGGIPYYRDDTKGNWDGKGINPQSTINPHPVHNKPGCRANGKRKSKKRKRI